MPKPSATELFPGRAAPAAPVVTQAPALTVSPIKPLAADRYALKLTISERIAGKLKQAQALTPQAPAGDLLATVLEKALDLYIADRLKQTFAVGRKPRRASPPNGMAAATSRHIPAAIRRAVYIRDGGQCTFVSRAGKRCTALVHLEFHHRKPFSHGGAHTVGNLQVLCKSHNAYHARLDFGDAKITQHVTQSQAH